MCGLNKHLLNVCLCTRHYCRPRILSSRVREDLTEVVVPEQGGEGAGEGVSPVGVWAKVHWAEGMAPARAVEGTAFVQCEEHLEEASGVEQSGVTRHGIECWSWKGDPFQGPRAGSCPTLGNELSEETHVLTKQETLLGRGAWVQSSGVREPRRTALPHGSQTQVLW